MTGGLLEAANVDTARAEAPKLAHGSMPLLLLELTGLPLKVLVVLEVGVTEGVALMTAAAALGAVKLFSGSSGV